MNGFPVRLTEKAASKIFEFLQEEGNFSLKLRVSVTGGGCKGLQYQFTFDSEVSEQDVLITHTIMEDGHETVQLLVDEISITYLKGAMIDYEESIEGEYFIIRGLKTATFCGCGSSFSMDSLDETGLNVSDRSTASS